MKSLQITGQIRENLGKKESKKIREQGLVPVVLYGSDEVVHLTLAFSDLREFVYTPSVFLLDLSVDGKTYKAMIQDVQWHPIEEQILHIDLLKIDNEIPVKIGVPVELVGTAKGIKAGGKIKFNLRKLRIKAMVDNLPDTIKIDITKLNIGDSIKVEEMKLDNITFLDNKSNTIVGVVSTRLAKSGAGALDDEDELEEGAAGDEAAAETTESAE